MHKLYYSISEVSEVVDEEQHILRYWEKEFDGLKPKKNRGGNRIYSEADLKIVKAIKILIRVDKLSLKGAKEQLIKIIKNEKIEQFINKYSQNLDDDIEHEKVLSNGKSMQSTKVHKELLTDVYNLMKDTVDYLKSL